MSKNEMTIVFVVNGEDVSLTANPAEPLGAARNKALAVSRNTGRPPDEWEIRDEAGVMLDPGQKIATFGWGQRVRLFLALKVGAGG